MEFDSSLPIKERILKRRRQKRKRLIIVGLFLFAILISSAVAMNKDAAAGKEAEAQTVSAGVVTDEKIPGGEKEEAVLESEPGQPDGEPAAGNADFTPPAPVSKDLGGLKQAIEQYIKGYTGTYGVYYSNLATGEEFGINHTEVYTAASTFKIPLNLYLFEKIKSGSVRREGTLTYLKQDYEEGAGQIQYEKAGKKYTVCELSRLSIEVSDNVAANILIRFLGKSNIKSYMRKCGGIVVKEEENVSCPKDMALYMKLVNDFSNKSGTLGQELMGYFLNTEQNDRITARLPGSVKVAHKTGNQLNVIHDVGIVFARQTYVLAVMSKEANEGEANDVIASVSKMVYDYVEKNGKK